MAKVYVINENGTSATSAQASSLTWIAIIMCVIVLILTIVLFIKILDIPSRGTISSPIVPASSDITARSAPEPSSTPANSRLSPRTPQPFVEYLRRTIDETPYYKRDGRRRFDPQHTY